MQLNKRSTAVFSKEKETHAYFLVKLEKTSAVTTNYQPHTATIKSSLRNACVLLAQLRGKTSANDKLCCLLFLFWLFIGLLMIFFYLQFLFLLVHEIRSMLAGYGYYEIGITYKFSNV